MTNLPVGPSVVIPPRTGDRLLARRNCPEIIRPTAAASTLVVPGTSWALGTRVNLVTSAQFGHEPLLFVGVGASVVDGTVLSADDTIRLVDEGQAVLYADMNRGAGDVSIGAFLWHTWGLVQMAGRVDDAVTATVIAMHHRRYPMPHLLMPPGTLLRADAAIRNSTALASLGIRITPYFYDPKVYQLFEVPVSVHSAAIGYDQIGDLARQRCFPTLGSVQVTAIGTWVELEAQLDADYLIEGWCMGSTNAAVAAMAVEFATCQPGSLPGPLDVQARGAYRRPAISPFGALIEEFFDPFIAYKGERLMATMAESGISDPFVMLYGRRI